MLARRRAPLGAFLIGCPNTVPPSDEGALAPPLWASAGAGRAASRRPAASGSTSRRDIPCGGSAPAADSATRGKDPAPTLEKGPVPLCKGTGPLCSEHAAHDLRGAELGERLV